MESRLENITSWTSYKPLTKDEDDIFLNDKTSEQTKTQAAASEGKKTGDRNTLHPKGAQALYEDLETSPGDTSKLNFQWMRMHPALLLQASPQNSASKISFQSSVLVNKYAQGENRKRSRDENTCLPRFPKRVVLPTNILDSNNDSQSSVFQLPNIGVDLTKLFDPALHSEWLPGQDLSTNYIEKYSLNAVVSDEKSCKVDGSEIRKRDPHLMKMEKDLKTFISSITCGKEIPPHKNITDGSKTQNDLIRLSRQGWVNILPLREVMAMFPEEEETKIFLNRCDFLCRLVSSIPSISLGEYLLDAIIPVMFDAVNEETAQMPKVAEKIKEISALLIRRCGMGNMTKGEIDAITKNLPRNDVGIDLNMSIASEYFEYWGKETQ
jgi:hypothetical protein